MQNSERRRAAAYIRVSTEDQTEYSPDAQLAEIRKYASREGYTILDEHIYVDEGITGRRTEKRDAFNRMIKAAKTKPKPFDAILLWKFSRFARNREDSIVYKSMLRKQLGIDVISVSEPVGDDKMSVLIEALIEAMDEYYSVNLSEEVKRGMAEKARRGGLQTSAPFGYRAENGRLVPAPGEDDLVREAFARFIAGEGFYQIARWLNDTGARTHRGNRFENRTVEYMLQNPAYIGKLRWNPTGRTRRDFENENIILADAGHKPLVDYDVWGKAQARIAALKALRKRKARPESELKDWPSGIVRCSSCGSTLVFSRPHYYRCRNYARGACKTSQNVRAELIKDAIVDRLRRDCLGAMPLRAKAADFSLRAADELKRLKAALESVGRKISRLREAFLAGAESLEEYKRCRDALSSEAEEIRSRIEALELSGGGDGDGFKPPESLLDVAEAFFSPLLPMHAKHNAANRAIESCVFDKSENLLKIVYRLSYLK